MNPVLESVEIDWKSLFEEMSLGFALHKVVWDEDRKLIDLIYTEVNPVYETLTGLSREKVLGQKVTDLIPGLEPEWFERYEKVVKTGKPVAFEQEASPLGKIYKVYAFKTGADTMATIFTDITAEKRLEAATESGRVLIDTLINSIPDLIFSKDLEGRYLVCNEAFASEFVGKPREMIIGKTDKEIFGNKEMQQQLFINEKDKEVVNNSGTLKYEWDAMLASGKTVRLETMKTSFKNAQGKIIGLVGVSRDVTERKKAEDQLHERAATLEAMNKMMVSRELKMIELKKQIELLQKDDK